MFLRRGVAGSKNKQVDWVNNTRFLALFLVITYHWTASLRFGTESNIAIISTFKEALSYFIMQGYQGVALFFFISAFGITLNFDKYKKIQEFYEKRIKAIYPSYLVVVAIAVILSVFSILKVFDIDSGLLFWIKNLTLIEFKNNLQGGVWVGYFNPAWWFLFGIIQFYLIFPLLYYVIKKMTLIFNLITLLILCFICTLIDDSITPIVIMYLPIFYAGILLGICYKKNFFTFKSNYPLAILGIIFWAFCLLFFNIENGTGMSRIVAPIGLIIFAIFGLNFKTSKTVTNVNAYSYEMYLIHNILILFFPIIMLGFAKIPVQTSNWLIGYILYIALTYIAARNISHMAAFILKGTSLAMQRVKPVLTDITTPQ